MFCFIAGNGFEDIEALAIIDVLRRAEINIDLYGVNDVRLRSRSNVYYIFEKVFSKLEYFEFEKYNGILIPGGPGVYELTKNDDILKLIRKFNEEKKLIYAICAAPLLLDRAGILEGKNYTSYPGVEIKSGNYIDDKVVVDGNIITSKGVGTAILGALKIVEIVKSKDFAKELAKKMVFEY